MALWQRHAPVMSAQPSRGHDGAWWLRLNLMVLTLGLVVVVVLGSALWTRLQPADTTWPQPRAVTGSAIAARPEGHLFYPASKVVSRPLSDEQNSGFGSSFSSAGAMLFTKDVPDRVYAWYKQWLLAHSWQLHYSGPGTAGANKSTKQYYRGTREVFTAAIDDPILLGGITGGKWSTDRTSLR
jgi:hypothetical protein